MLFYVIQVKLHRIALQSDGAEATEAAYVVHRVRDRHTTGTCSIASGNGHILLGKTW